MSMLTKINDSTIQATPLIHVLLGNVYCICDIHVVCCRSWYGGTTCIDGPGSTHSGSTLEQTHCSCQSLYWTYPLANTNTKYMQCYKHMLVVSQTFSARSIIKYMATCEYFHTNNVTTTFSTTSKLSNFAHCYSFNKIR